jgi:hypothetical protein
MAQRVAFIVAELGSDADPFMLHLCCCLACREHCLELAHLGAATHKGSALRRRHSQPAESPDPHRHGETLQGGRVEL